MEIIIKKLGQDHWRWYVMNGNWMRATGTSPTEESARTAADLALSEAEKGKSR